MKIAKPFTKFVIAMLLLPASLQAKEITIKDNITGRSGAATNSLNNQVNPGRQILLSQHNFASKTQVTRFQMLSSTALTTANSFRYVVRALDAPNVELFSGTATRTSRTLYTAITQGGNNTNLDEFSIVGLTLDPGTYYFGVHSSDGNAYQSIASTGAGAEKLLAENGGTPFLAGADFLLYTALFGMTAIVEKLNSFAEQTSIAFETIPVNSSLVNSAGMLMNDQINQRLSALRNNAQTSSNEGVSRAALYGGGNGDDSIFNNLRFWIDGNFADLDRDTSSSFSGYDSTSSGGQLGIDFAITPSLSFGMSYGRTDMETGISGNLGNSDVTGNHFSVYAQHIATNGVYANLVYSYEDYDLDLERSAGSAGRATASTDSNAHNVQAAVGYLFPSRGAFSYSVEARANYSDIHVDGYSETGAIGGSLAVTGQNTEALSASVGLDMRYDLGKFQPYAGVFYEYSELSFDDISIALTSDASFSSTQGIDTSDGEQVNFDIGFDYLISDDVAMNAGYSTSFFNSSSENHSLFLGLSYSL
ncbi:autotransporter outer membrane beta-barrel domain-containing protein [Roseovarius sp. EL26]|uniref:autotransporter outer membrane beta-barrel domain-containing protein n=1 Tax=Roseovarius sp. EL26 TaxID=2126672 RepID=UPI000EA2E78C|nr:autotransporter outer membrane beta-barrel domain-containing protein [Roseovarius sp. EL26]